ncbi:outer membrane receptor protein involved in Fe transport [Pedobacter sp. UYP30]|uniref:TonB-dependent receptor domain-containing protein n=1 Tax=Pedobacter sp. UYP30 TaxID=1756400 RepID=UPI003397DC5C
MKTNLLTITFLLFTLSLFAQKGNQGKITGVLKDAKTQETIPFATAVLLNPASQAKVKIVQTDVNGAFSISNIPIGKYTFKISFVGYQTMVRSNVEVTAATKTLNFGNIQMTSGKGNVLSEVQVTGKKASIQLGIDKKIFSVDQSLVSEGGSASDVLQNVPSIQTDIDGNVSLRGSAGVKVLIDGKQSLIAGGDISQILQSIPASSIESVEVITNPSSKYDAEGQSGIINIVLKKNTKLGFNGSVAVTAGNKDNYNASTNLSFQNSKVNLYGNYSYRYGNRYFGGFQNIDYFQPIGDINFANQLTDSRSTDKGNNVKAGIDYYITDKSIVSFSGGFNSRDNNRNELINISQLTSGLQPVKLSNRNNLTNGTGNSYDLNLDYTQKFNKPKEELTFNFGYSNGVNDNNQAYDTQITNLNGTPTDLDAALQNIYNSGNNSNYNIQADYTLPVGQNGKIEAGYRSQIKLADNTQIADSLLTGSSIDISNNLLNNFFKSKDQVHALYLNYQNQLNNFGYQIGLRGEDAQLNTYLEGYNNNLPYATPGKIQYKRLYPSVFLTQKFKGDQQLQLSYTRRVNRPRAWETNPFLDVSDPLNYRQGNPNLIPEDVHSFELGYSKYWQNVTFTGSVYLRKTNDVVERVRSEPDANGIIITTPQNLSSEINTGLELIAQYTASKKLNFTGNVNLYQSDLKGAPAFGIAPNSGFSYNGNLTANLSYVKHLTIQIRGEYRGAEVQPQGKRNAIYNIDAGAKYDLLNGKASLSFNVRDVFNTRKYSFTNIGQNASTAFERQLNGTMGNLTFSYRFGKSTFKMNKQKKGDQQQDNRGDETSF